MQHPVITQNTDHKLEKRLPPLGKAHCEKLIAAQIIELTNDSDFVVLVVYDRESGAEPIDYQLYDFKKGDFPDQVPSALDFEGIYVWYFCKREGEHFQARKLLIEREFGHYANGQFGDFKGFWDEFPQYVSQDRWVQNSFANTQS